MRADQSRLQAARNAVALFEERLTSRLGALDIDPERYVIEIGTCCHAEGPEFEYREDCVYLDQMSSYKNREGLGGMVMRTLLALADEMGMTIVLNAASQKLDERNPGWKKRHSKRELRRQAYRFTALSQEELEAWYQRLGFIFTAEDTSLMKRVPGTPIPPPRERLPVAPS